MSKIYFAEKTDVEALETPYLTCSTSAATAAKTVSKSGFILKAGAAVNIRFTYANTASSPTLNINGTGAKPIYRNGRNIGAADIFQYGVYCFVYDGSCWQLTQT